MNEDEMTGTRTDHWQSVYTTKTDDSVSWFEQSPNASLELIKAAAIGSGSVIDIGGGASKLVDALVAKGHSDVAVLDLSAQALEIAKARLGSQADKIKWMIGDVTAWNPTLCKHSLVFSMLYVSKIILEVASVWVYKAS